LILSTRMKQVTLYSGSKFGSSLGGSQKGHGHVRRKRDTQIFNTFIGGDVGNDCAVF
jgi:hypothetical protein